MESKKNKTIPVAIIQIGIFWRFDFILIISKYLHLMYTSAIIEIQQNGIGSNIFLFMILYGILNVDTF